MKNRNRVLGIALALTLLVTVFSGCGSSGEDETGTLKFGIIPGNIRAAVQLLADDLGYYEEEGVKVEFVEAADHTAALTSISTNKGEIDVWGLGILPELNFIANGSDIVIFGGTAAEGHALVSRPGDVEYYKDFGNYEGATVATVRADTAWVLAFDYLKEQGVDGSKINILEVDSQQTAVEAVKKGEADVASVSIWFANTYSSDVAIVYEVGDLIPMYVCCRQATSGAILESKRDELIAFTKANLRALKYYEDEANRDEVVKFLAEYTDQTEEYILDYQFGGKAVMTLDPNKEGIADYYNLLVEAGNFTGDVDINDHVTTEIYDEALAQLIEEYPDDPFYASLKK